MVVDPTISYFGGLMNKPKFDPEALKALKTQRNLSAQAVSDLSGVPVSTVNRILRGEGEPNINAVAAIVHALGGSLDDVCGFPKKEGHGHVDDRLFQVMQDTIRAKERWLVRIGIALAVVILFILIVVAYDILNGDVGWARYSAYFPTGGMSEVLEYIVNIFKT